MRNQYTPKIERAIAACNTHGISVRIEQDRHGDYMLVTAQRGGTGKTKTIQKHDFARDRKPGETADMAAERLVVETIAELTKYMIPNPSLGVAVEDSQPQPDGSHAVTIAIDPAEPGSERTERAIVMPSRLIEQLEACYRNEITVRITPDKENRRCSVRMKKGVREYAFEIREIDMYVDKGRLDLLLSEGIAKGLHAFQMQPAEG